MSISEKLKNSRTRNLIVLGVLLFLVVYISPSMFVILGPGQVGVLFKPLAEGTTTDRVYEEGLHVFAPWNVMYPYDARLQTLTKDMRGLSKTGLSIQLTVSMRYRLQKEGIPDLHKNIGPEYVKVLLVPVLSSSVREALGHMTPEELYTSCSTRIQDNILKECRKELQEFSVSLDQVIVESLKLPKTVDEAIEKKLRLEQAYLEYEFKLKKEEKEVARQMIVAQGIKKFQEIAPEHLSPGVSQWLGYQATMELAKSQNTKVLVLSGGEMRLPLVLDPDSATKKNTSPINLPPHQPEKIPAADAPPQEVSQLGSMWQKIWNEIHPSESDQ